MSFAGGGVGIIATAGSGTAAARDPVNLSSENHSVSKVYGVLKVSYGPDTYNADRAIVMNLRYAMMKIDHAKRLIQ